MSREAAATLITPIPQEGKPQIRSQCAIALRLLLAILFLEFSCDSGYLGHVAIF